VVNDRHEAVEVEAQVGVLGTEEDGVRLETLRVRVPANEARRIWTRGALEDPTRQVVVGRLLVGGEVVSRASYYDPPPREMHFAAPQVRREQWWQDSDLHLRLAADGYVPVVGLFGLPGRARPEDNYFSLLPGEPREIVVRGLTEEEAAGVRVEAVL
jgi:hypothetical protein